MWRATIVLAATLGICSGRGADNALPAAGGRLPPGKSIDARYVGDWQARTERQVLYHTAYPDGEFERWRLEKGRVVTARGIWYVEGGVFHIVLLQVRGLLGAAMVDLHRELEERISGTTDRSYTVDEPTVPAGYLRWDCMRRDVPDGPPSE